MKTLEYVIENYQKNCIDSRDLSRLADYVPQDKLEKFGYALKDGETWEPKEFTEKNIIEQLKDDVQFGLMKARDQRGISASMMFEVVKMWLWILDDDEFDFDYRYYGYGLEFFSAVKEKYCK
jgi:hypothetical protein